MRIIRFADEGFKNYEHTINLNGTETKVSGCYVFFKKTFKEALRYDKYMPGIKDMISKGLLKERIKEAKNIASIADNSTIYARNIDFSKLEIVETNNEINIQPESYNGINIETFVKITAKEHFENIKTYENLEKKLKAKAKANNLYFTNFNKPYLYYEAIINEADAIQ